MRIDLTLMLVTAFLGVGEASAGANLKNAPAAFTYKEGKAVFVDFKDAKYSIEYSVLNGLASVSSEIEFESAEEGYPVFDLVPEPTEVTVDGERVPADEVRSPDRATRFRVIGTKFSAGPHTLKIKSLFTKDIVVRDQKIASGIWTTDLEDRGYLEKYVPSNFEFDQVPMTFSLKIVGGGATEYRVFTNGKLEIRSRNSFTIETPEYFNTTSFFLHLVPADSVAILAFEYPSIDGRVIPIVIYGRKGVFGGLELYREKTLETLKELEADYGAWPHPALLVYGAGAGGMEYSGATITSLDALEHEIFHSYHARGLMPGNGNSGWMDEAIASWRDIGYALRDEPGYSRSNMGNRTPYSRSISYEPYSWGRDFLAAIAQKLEDKELSLKVFLREYFETYKYQTVDTKDFLRELNKFAQSDFASSFDRYIFGVGGLENEVGQKRSLEAIHPLHRPLTEVQRADLLFP